MDAPGWLDDLDLSVDGPPWLGMGVRRAEADAWLLVDERRADDLAERARLLAVHRDEVVHLGPGTERAGAEVLTLVDAWLTAHGVDASSDPARGRDTSSADAPAGEHPLVTAARRVQEDLCVMVPRPTRDGAVRHHLDAAVVCFPSHWRLADKAGRPAALVHAPVPTYAEHLADRVDRYLDRLRPGMTGVRRNWSVHETPALFAPTAPPVPDLSVPPPALWLRSERQTLRRLDTDAAVLFTIRVQQVPFAVLAGRADVAAAFAARLRAQPPEVSAMNGLDGRVEAVAAWLDQAAGGHGSADVVDRSPPGR